MIKKLILTLLCFLSVSCANTKGWVYKSGSYDIEKHSYLSNKTVAVLPFADKRSNENTDAMMLYLIPLVPLGYQDFSAPESVARHANSGLWINFNPKEDFAKAMSEELNTSKIAKEAFFANSARDSDYYISGELLSLDYNSRLFSYGLSVYGPILWFVGFPATHVSNDLEVKLSLIDSKSKKVIFTKHYKADHYKKLGWIYSLPNDFRYSEMLAELYRQFINDMSKSNSVTGLVSK